MQLQRLLFIYFLTNYIVLGTINNGYRNAVYFVNWLNILDLIVFISTNFSLGQYMEDISFLKIYLLLISHMCFMLLPTLIATRVLCKFYHFSTRESNTHRMSDFYPTIMQILMGVL
jgi:hypothetical protein